MLKELGSMFVKYVDSRSTQASSQKRVGEFLHEKSKSVKLFDYIIEAEVGGIKFDAPRGNTESVN